LRDGEGSRVIEQLIHVVPISLLRIRFLFAWEALTPDGISLQGDVKGAYTTSRLGGPPTYLHLPRNLQPNSWSGRFVRPVVRIHMAMYGLARSGHDWNQKARSALLKLNYTLLRDGPEDSMYLKEVNGEVIVVVVYTDDFGMSGEKTRTMREYEILNQVLGFQARTEYQLDDIVGIERTLRYRDENMCELLLHQSSYTSTIVRQFELRHYNGAELKGMRTPMKSRDDEHDKDLIGKPGRMAGKASEHVGKFLWLVRGSRPDIAVAVSRIGRRVTKWDALCDEYILRLYKYLKHTRYLGVCYRVFFEEVPRMVLILRADADHSGDPMVTTKSTAGYITHLRGVRSKILMDWGAHLEPETAYSTPEAEFVAAAHGTMRSLIPVGAVLEDMLRRCLISCTGLDNSTAIQIIEAGYSRRLSYLKKYQRVSIGLLHDWNSREENFLFKVLSARNVADIMTKILDFIVHWEHCERLGLDFVDTVQNLGVMLEDG
jgi:hypothetical protein